MANRSHRCDKCAYDDNGKGCDVNSDHYQLSSSFQCSQYEKTKKTSNVVKQLTHNKKEEKPKVQYHADDEIIYLFNQ